METHGQLQEHFAPFALDFLRLCVWLVLLGAVFVPLERWCALRPQKVFRKAFGADLVYYFLGGILPKLLLILPLTLISAGLHHFEPIRFYPRVASMPLGTRVAAAMVVGEIGSYWGHRWSHEIPLLWRFHAIHHSAEEIDWLVNTRAHPVDLLFTRLCSLTPMYVLGLAQPLANSLDLVPVLVTLAGTFWGFFIHANVSWRFGWLEWLLSSPAFHHWHHTNDGPERINKNYAPMLPWVDKCFGTFFLPKQEWPLTYGTETQIAPSLAGQLLQPLTQRDPSVLIQADRGYRSA
jgi:sterol desaturase/sphingolipid hydroxylase (fatty acid hydroxylase superfamily)